MTFTYSASSTTVTDLYFVRLRIGDTSSGSARFQDEEINNLLSIYGNRYIAAAVAAETIGAQYAARTDKTVGKLSISQGSLSKHYFDLGRQLRHEAGLHATPFAGGISVAQKDSETSDTDRVDPAFSVGAFDNPGTLVDESSAY